MYNICVFFQSEAAAVILKQSVYKTMVQFYYLFYSDSANCALNSFFFYFKFFG